MAVQPGECWAVVGPNGAGKSSLLLALAGLLPAASGSVHYDDVPIGALSMRERARHRAWLAQDRGDAFPEQVQDAVLAGRHPHLSRWQWESGHDRALARDALASVGLDGFAERDLATLSGGERQRVALAAILAQDAPLLILDEPCAHLDPGAQVAVMDMLVTRARGRGSALLIALHELHLAVRYADHAIAIGDGRALVGSAADILEAPTLSSVFHHPLVDVGEATTRTFLPR